MWPSVGSSKPPIIRSVVVLPHPDGPSIAKKAPRGISTEIPSTATVSSNRLTTCSSRTSGAVVSVPVTARAYRGGSRPANRCRRRVSPQSRGHDRVDLLERPPSEEALSAAQLPGDEQHEPEEQEAHPDDE